MENDKKLMSGAGDPPTSRWTVTDDGDIDNGEGWYLRMYRYTGMEVGAADSDDKEWVAAALNAGHPNPADTEPTAEQIGVWLIEHRGWDTADVEELVEGFACARAALMREGDDSRE